MSENFIASPCVRSCCLDQNDICFGCGRSLVEITGWQSASNDRKQEIITMAALRLEERSKILRDLLK
jgi:predicted Fe-S protein YdhL (DUF1289 family)